MASFKNIENTASKNATYSAYKNLTAQDVVISWYSAKKFFSIDGEELSAYGVFSLLTDRYIEVPVVQCDAGSQFTGGESFPSIQTISLGEDIGTVLFDFNAYNVPDKFIVEYDGVEVINTGYRGLTSYQSQLDTLLAARGLPSEAITYPGSGTASFVKTNISPTTATVKVYGPFSNTGWNYTLYCPDGLIPSPTPTPTITPTITVSPTVTPTKTVSPTVTPSISPTLTPTRTVSPTPTPTSQPTQTPAATQSPTPTVSIQPTKTPTVTPTSTPSVSVQPTPTPTPTVSLDLTEFVMGFTSKLTVNSYDPAGAERYQYTCTTQTDLAGASSVVTVGSPQSYSAVGALVDATTGDEAIITIERLLPDDSPYHDTTVEITVNSPSLYSSITSPSGKSNPYTITAGTSVDGGPDWSWVVNDVQPGASITVDIIVD